MALSSTSPASTSLPRSSLTCPRIESASGNELALPGRSGDRQGAFGVSFALGVSVEVELGAGEVGDGVESLRDFGVVEGVDEVCGLGAACERLDGGVARGRGEHGDGGRRREKRSITERPGGDQRAFGPLAHRWVVHDCEAVHRKVDHQRCEFG